MFHHVRVSVCAYGAINYAHMTREENYIAPTIVHNRSPKSVTLSSLSSQNSQRNSVPTNALRRQHYYSQICASVCVGHITSVMCVQSRLPKWCECVSACGFASGFGLSLTLFPPGALNAFRPVILRLRFGVLVWVRSFDGRINDDALTH